MKTKAYKLAAELGLQEHSVLEWLRENGYPNARRADTIRSEVAQAARQALGRAAGVRTLHSGNRASVTRAVVARPVTPSRPPPQSRKSWQQGPTGGQPAGQPQGGSAGGSAGGSPVGSQSGSAGGHGNNHGGNHAGNHSGNHGGNHSGGRPESGFKVSFAELLENHLPGDAAAGLQALPEIRAALAPASTAGASTAAATIAAASPRSVADVRDELRIRIARAEADRDRIQQKLDVEKARAEGYIRDAQRLEIELATVRLELAALAPAREDNERLELERARLRQALAEAADERATLEQTCADLQTELTELRTALDEAKRGDIDHGTVLGDLETARQREVAWRTRALELERAVAQGGDIIRLLKGHGLEAFRQQVRVLQTLLADESTALPVLKSIRQVDAPALEKLVEERLRRTCAHPLCNHVTHAAGKIALRVDDDRECAVCGGDAERRWFNHMVQECVGAGVRRLLVIGGAEATQQRLRTLSEGEPVDLRLVSADEEVLPARAAGRVEGCDALILWSRWVVPTRISDPYAQAALAVERPIVSVLGVTCGVVALARATVNRLARTHVLRAV